MTVKSLFAFIKRKISLLGIFLFLGLNTTYTQIFSEKGGDIIDNNGEFHRDFYPIKVKDLPSAINCEFGLAQACINIQHPRVSDLKISLMSPDGTEIWLTNRNGNTDGRNYLNTCFSNDGFNGFIFNGKAPFTGQFIPDGRINLFNNQQNPNGTWFLIVEDLRKEAFGQVLTISLHFGADINCSLPSLQIDDPASCKCPENQNDCILLPDLMVLKSLTETQWQRFPPEHPLYPNELRLGVGMANIGLGPLEIRGTSKWYCQDEIVDKNEVCQDSSRPHQKVEQLLFEKKNGRIDTVLHTGSNLYFDDTPGHNHYHADNWVNFVLLKKKFLKKDPKKWRIIGQSKKVSYCLFDTNRCINKLGNCTFQNIPYGKKNLLNYGLGNYFDCNSEKQGISVGGIDYYGIMYEGQSIPLPRKLKSGTYYILVEVDPENHYVESNEENNSILIKITL